MPSAPSTADVHLATSGATNELPAPVSSVAWGRACAAPVRPESTTAAVAARTPSSVMVFLLKLSSSPSCLVLESIAASMPALRAGVGRRKVKVWLQAGERGSRDAAL